uniref:Uncharacterized protein n=1 Tax=Hemiselmis andersenii TaxID=464988 RepID=A0A6T8MPJ5_HEMAN|mmetsp:Transcript_32966/g.76735  ORF Transcript_32966/g.76735 Transcript_32966/m.76735 type:complete len:102 (+) Transcript_32966:963-1268(+)
MFSFCLMQKVFSSLATDFLKNALVVSSIDQHIVSLEKCINAVTTLYNPKIAPQKAGYYDKFKGCSEKDRKIITKKLYQANRPAGRLWGAYRPVDDGIRRGG